MPKNEMKVRWRMFVDANTDKGAAVLLTKVGEVLNFPIDEARIEPYHKGGFVLTVMTTMHSESWSEAVISLLDQAQRLGRGWQLSGDILEELDAWSTETTIAGVQSAQVQCQKLA